jgi:cytochrome c oxidase subunit II
MRLALAIALLLIAAVSLWLFIAHPWWFPGAASLTAGALDHEFRIAFWVFGGLFVAAQILLAAFLFGSRKKRRSDYIVGNWKLEIAWTLAIAALFFWFNTSGEKLWSSLMGDHHRTSNALQVEITGAQFQWYFRYPGRDSIFGKTDAQKFARPEEGNPLGLDPGDPAGGDDIISSSLVLPVGGNVELTLRAQDVIHSVFIPAMRFKQDTVPGMTIHAHLQPTRTGNYEIACAELCGLGHYRMRAQVRVVTPEEFASWLRAQQKSHEGVATK